MPLAVPAHPSPDPPRRLSGDDAGSVAVEMVLITPLVILLLLLAVGMSRMVSARIDTDAAAQQAARAASLAPSPTTAEQAAQQTAQAALVGEGRTCTELRVSTDTTGFHSGGSAKVTVTCTTTLTDLGVPLPGHHSSTGSASAPIDTYTYVAGGTP